ncbi:DJ-1/PfpI family protein [Catenuloplanes japonicus]|uniref:DJ-1/PfpI family protein n=1 Tax=Catenuloplanes japonicus TaxID=33876 RepID=UPI0005249311|nr:DJ-1/PfpI family protein [Catenuloplanes japonicus]
MRRRDLLVGSATLGAGALLPGRVFAPDHPLRVRIVMFDGVEEQDFIGPYEVFSLAGRLSGGAIEVAYTVLDGPRAVTAAFGTRVAVDHGWRPDEADLLVVPGGGFGRPNDPGIWAEINNGALPAALAAARRPGLVITSLCTGAIILGAAGLVAGRPCTTHTGAKAELAARGGLVKNARVVDDGDLVTAAGVTSGLDLALHLVHREAGADVAIRAEEVLEYQARGTVWTSGTSS